MTDAQVATPSNRPEYTAEQVAEATARLEELTRNCEIYRQVKFGSDIRTILSALASKDAELTTCRETLRLKPSESLPAGVTRLALQVERTEADSRRLGWIDNAEDERARRTEPDEDENRPARWHVKGNDGEGHEHFSTSLRVAIDAAMTKERE